MAGLLVKRGEHEAEDEQDRCLREAFTVLRRRLQPPFLWIPTSAADHRGLTQALVYGVLTEPPAPARSAHLTHLHATVTDGYALFSSTLLRLTLDAYPRLLPGAKSRLLAAAGELAGVGAAGADLLLISLLRWLEPGDRWLPDQLLRLLTRNHDYLLSQPRLLGAALLRFLRRRGAAELRFCAGLLRRHFPLCAAAAGRDLVRHLQDLAAAPEIAAVWRDLLRREETLPELYRRKTPPQLLLTAVSPDAEKKLRFLLTRVNAPSRARYLGWFARKHLPGHETAELVRFVCCCHHPPNEVLRSEVLPRWMLIGWLLMGCRRQHLAANAKLALFYDWLFFDDAVDGIMDVEPAVLLMVRSLDDYPGLTQSLMEFLILLVRHYDEDRRLGIRHAVANALRAVVRQGVVRSLDVLCGSAAISPALRAGFAALFCEENSN
ncbi:embryo defective 2739 [Wolffia australiana]